MQNVTSYLDFKQKSDNYERVALLLYNPENESSKCAFRTLKEAAESNQRTQVFFADVKQVQDIHPVYQISSAPSILLFMNSKLVNVVKGCQESSYLKALINNEIPVKSSEREALPLKQVTVYSTPTCSWCNTLKSWLRKNNISFKDIDVSRDEKAARDLVKRSGQQGVPQTEINGQIVVGFNQQRLKELLEIQ